VCELLEGAYEVQTLYQLVLALLVAKQSSGVVKQVRDIIDRAELLQKFQVLHKAGADLSSPELKSTNKALLLCTLESIFASLPSCYSSCVGPPRSRYISNELGRMLVDYRLVDWAIATMVFSQMLIVVCVH
jgi:hypothetical protein